MPGLLNIPESMSIALHTCLWIVDDPRAFRPSPVIAKELGFQLIALTAHEDGNFIRKYFPVVYSCRFANIAGHKGKVLQPEMEIKTAAFEELKPENKARLDDYEEMGLF